MYIVLLIIKWNSPRKRNHFALLFRQFEYRFENSIAVLMPIHCIKVRIIKKFKTLSDILLQAIASALKFLAS